MNKRVVFSTRVAGSPELDIAFKPVQEAVEKAHKAGKMGAVFCQIYDNKDGSYTVRGAFYPYEKAEIINAALKEAMKVSP